MTRRREQIGDALRRQVTSGLHLGLLRPGQRLGSARDTARRLGTDYRVVVAAARQLERDGLLEVRPRAGLFVGVDGAPAAPMALSGLGERLVAWLAGEVNAGTPVTGFADLVRRCLESVRVRAACLECNGDQLDFLCDELGRDYGIEATPFLFERLPLDLPRVRRADLLVSTVHHAGEVRQLAGRLDKPFALVRLDPVQREEILARLRQGLVYVVGTDPRWPRKLRQIWQPEEGAGNLRAVTLGSDDLGVIPEDAAVLVMPGARRRLAGHPLLARALAPRGLSRESARQLLTFVVQRNLAAALSVAPIAAR